MTMMEQFEQIEARMERSFRERRFDTFNLLVSDRLVLLQRAMQSPEKAAVLAMLQRQGPLWVDRLRTCIAQSRPPPQGRSMGGYGGTRSRSGRMVNKPL